MSFVKCRYCGFLAIRDPFSPEPTVFEASTFVRDTGWQNTSTGQRTVARVFCYANVRQFAEPINDRPDAIVTEIDQQIDCPDFITWRQGKSPEKHEEITLLEQVREENRQSQERADKKAAEREQKEDVRQRRTFVVSIAALLVSAAVALVTLLDKLGAFASASKETPNHSAKAPTDNR